VSDWAMEKAREAYWRDCETTEKTIHSIATALREAEARGRASMKEDAAKHGPDSYPGGEELALLGFYLVV
jgi:hypothetical protein